MLDTGYWILDAGCWILDTGCWILDTGCRMLVAAQMLHRVYRKQVFVHSGGIKMRKSVFPLIFNKLMRFKTI